MGGGPHPPSPPPLFYPKKDEEPFNPDYVEVDRILDESHSVDKDNGEVSVGWREGGWGRSGVERGWGAHTRPYKRRPHAPLCFNTPSPFYPRLSARGLLPGQVVLPPLRGQHVGAEGGRGRGEDRRVQTHPSSPPRAQTLGGHPPLFPYDQTTPAPHPITPSFPSCPPAPTPSRLLEEAGAIPRVQKPQPAPRVPTGRGQLVAVQLVQQASGGDGDGVIVTPPHPDKPSSTHPVVFLPPPTPPP